jgi:hypothetical protein
MAGRGVEFSLKQNALKDPGSLPCLPLAGPNQRHCFHQVNPGCASDELGAVDGVFLYESARHVGCLSAGKELRQ